MAERSKIEWTDHTFNPWIGCQKVSPACDHCYAESWATRFGQVGWGPGAPRKRTSLATWRAPVHWDARAAAAGRRERVFCASLADVFDNQVPAAWRADLWRLIAATPHLDWQLLTKRIGNVAAMLPPGFPAGFGHVGLMATVESQEVADRDIYKLRAVQGQFGVSWVGLSCEPLLGPLDLTPSLRGLDWVICGGESGTGARPMHPDWARSVRDQCEAAGVAFFFKQWGEWAPDPGMAADGSDPVMEGAKCVVWDGRRWAFHDNGYAPHRDAGVGEWVYRLGKKRAGRRLDGRTWNGLPA